MSENNGVTKRANGAGKREDKGKAFKDENPSNQKWRRVTAYLITAIKKVLIVKTVCDAIDNRPVGSESVIYTVMCDASDMAKFQLDRVITVLGSKGLLYLVDSNVYIEIDDGMIVGGDVTRMKETITINQAMLNGRRIKIGQTSLKMKGDNVKTLDAVISAWNSMGLETSNAPSTFIKKDNANRPVVTDVSNTPDGDSEDISELDELPSTSLVAPRIISETDELPIVAADGPEDLKLFLSNLRASIDARDYVDEVRRCDEAEYAENKADLLNAFGMKSLPVVLPLSCQIESLSRSELVYVVSDSGIFRIPMKKGSIVVKVTERAFLTCTNPDV